MSEIDPEKLKVAELRDELKARGLDTKGVKAVLVKRLKDALDSGEGGGGVTTEGREEGGEGEEGEEEEDEEEEEEEEEGGDAEDEEEAGGGEEQEAAEGIGDAGDAGEDEVVDEEEGEGEAATADGEGEGGAEGGEEAAAGGDENGEEDIEMPDELGEEFRTIDETYDDHHDKRKRKRSRSRERHRGRRSHSRERRRTSPRKVEMDDCAWETGTTFQLDRYNSDLNLRVQDSGLKAHPLTVEGFAFMWAGARATFGVKAGKVAYEVKVLENLNVDHLPSDEANPHVLRVGWSTDDTSLQLGEEALSYGYGGTGKASTDCNFKDYGESFTTGDVITAYLDLDSDPVVMSYAKNGKDLGKCFEVEKEKLGDRALFPHVLTKNTEFECNFGAKEEPYFALNEEFVFLETLAEEERVRGSCPPANKEECEILMMVGLPGSGKTVWAGKYASENPEKKYNVLGTNNIIDKMKVMGLPRKKNYSGRWDVLIDKSTKCLNRLIEIAARKKRNYILDQTNVYASARRRKMQPFEGFQRKAIVVVPTDEEFKRRVEKSEKEEGKEVPEKAVLEMKANFTMPEVGQLFDKVQLTEEEHLSKDEAEKLVKKYRDEAIKLLPPPEKRFRDSRYGEGRRDFRDHRPRGGFRGGFDTDRRGATRGWRGGYSPRGGYESRGGGRGRYSDSRRYDDRRSYGGGGGGYRSGGGYQGPRGGGYGGGYGGGSGGYKGWGQQGSWGGGGGWGSQGQWSNSGYGGGKGYGGGQWQQGGWGGQQSYWGGGGGYGGSGYGSGWGRNTYYK